MLASAAELPADVTAEMKHTIILSLFITSPLHTQSRERPLIDMKLLQLRLFTSRR